MDKSKKLPPAFQHPKMTPQKTTKPTLISDTFALCSLAKFLYPFFGFHDSVLAVLTIGLFVPLIAFHFAVSSVSARAKNIIRIKSMLKKQNA
jgi:hypothetical protein